MNIHIGFGTGHHHHPPHHHPPPPAYGPHGYGYGPAYGSGYGPHYAGYGPHY